MILPKKNDDYIKSLLKSGESAALEFKLTVTKPHKIAKTLVAFSNTMGGIVLIGINDQRKIIGVDIEEEMHMIDLAISKHIMPAVYVKYEVFEIAPDFGNFEEEVYLLLVEVGKSRYPCRYRSPEGELIFLHRVNDRNVQVTSSSGPNSPPTAS